jgi:hypothetical protein
MRTLASRSAPFTPVRCTHQVAPGGSRFGEQPRPPPRRSAAIIVSRSPHPPATQPLPVQTRPNPGARQPSLPTSRTPARSSKDPDPRPSAVGTRHPAPWHRREHPGYDRTGSEGSLPARAPEAALVPTCYSPTAWARPRYLMIGEEPSPAPSCHQHEVFVSASRHVACSADPTVTPIFFVSAEGAFKVFLKLRPGGFGSLAADDCVYARS